MAARVFADHLAGLLRARHIWNMILTKSSFAGMAIDHHVVEQIVMPRTFPDLWMHDQGGFQPDHLKRRRRAGWLKQFVVSGHHVVVPHIANVSFEFRTQRTVVPESVLPAVDFRVLKYEATAFAQRNNLVHRTGHGAGFFPENQVVTIPASSVGWRIVEV